MLTAIAIHQENKAPEKVDHALFIDQPLCLLFCECMGLQKINKHCTHLVLSLLLRTFQM